VKVPPTGPTGVGILGVGVGRYCLATNGKYRLKGPIPEPEDDRNIIKKKSEMTNPPIQMERFLILTFILLPAPIAYNNRAKVAGAA
jgi:hypothetical protein